MRVIKSTAVIHFDKCGGICLDHGYKSITVGGNVLITAGGTWLLCWLI